MPASKLSQNLRGLCGISVAKAEQIAAKLQMRDDERQLFLALVESQHARSRVARQQAVASLQQIRAERIDEMSLEMFSTVRDWYHMAILEMTDIKGFKADVAWIAEKLGLPADLVKEAVERLKTLGLLTDGAGQWKQTQVDLELPSGVPSRTIREHHKQILTKAIVALDQTSVEKREYSSQTFAFDRAVLLEVKNLMREFQRKVLRLSHQGTKDSVYIMAMQLFPVVEAEAAE
jgi:uncharacterized protein (TIGR02147 family)